MTKKIKTLFLIVCTMVASWGLLMPITADAARKPSKTSADCDSGKIMDNPEFEAGNEEPKKICEPLGSNTDCKNNTGLCDKNPIVEKLNLIVNVLSGFVGVVVVGVIILGGIQYAMAGDKAEAVGAAKQRIINGLMALLAYLFIFAFLQWLIPGGVFK